MRKLKLDVEKLEVTSFAVEGQGGARGTVEGHLNQEAVSGPNTCEGLVDSCALSCATCGGDCNSAASVCGSWIGSLVTVCVCSD
jgi:hypothetical protein